MRIEKGSRERIEKRERDKIQFEEEGLKDPRPYPFLEFSRSSLAM